MKFLGDMHDNQLNKPYKLYQVNAKEVSERLHRDYNLPKITLQMFNSDADLNRYIRDIRELEQRGYTIDENDHRRKEVKKALAKIEDHSFLTEMNRKGISFGYEIMPIAVSASGDFSDLSSKLELIDGFKRMFGMDQVPEIDVLVKVYGVMNDREWINAMILYNSWKFADGEGSNKYMDRGFQLGMFYRYDISLVDFILPEHDIFKAINIYTTGNDLRSYWSNGGDNERNYQTLWDNACFADDIRSIYEILTFNPVFQATKKGKTEIVDNNHPKFNQRGMSRVLEVFVSLLGEVRRYELLREITTRKPFHLDMIKGYMSDPEIQKHMIKIVLMSVDGHIVNYIKDHLREDIKEKLYQSMGYVYTQKTKKKEPEQTFQIDASMF